MVPNFNAGLTRWGEMILLDTDQRIDELLARHTATMELSQQLRGVSSHPGGPASEGSAHMSRSWMRDQPVQPARHARPARGENPIEAITWARSYLRANAPPSYSSLFPAGPHGTSRQAAARRPAAPPREEAPPPYALVSRGLSPDAECTRL